MHDVTNIPNTGFSFLLHSLILRNLNFSRSWRSKSRSSGLWWHVAEYFAASIFRSPWRWRYQEPSKYQYPTSTLHGVTTRNTSTWVHLFISLPFIWTKPMKWRHFYRAFLSVRMIPRCIALWWNLIQRYSLKFFGRIGFWFILFKYFYFAWSWNWISSVFSRTALRTKNWYYHKYGAQYDQQMFTKE